MFSSANRLLSLLFSLYVYAALVATATMPRLVPSRRADFLRRGLDYRDVVPKQEALLSYSTAPHHTPIATISFTAHPNIPILLLEDIDHLLSEVVCSTSSPPPSSPSSLAIRFVDEDAFNAAFNSWSQLADSGFVVLTAHHASECNNHGERGSWRTTAVTSDKETLTVTLSVEPVHMREVGRSFGVRYNQGSGEYEHNSVKDDGGLLSRSGGDLVKRDTHSFDDVWTYGYTPDIEDRLTIFPVDGLSGDLLSKLDSANFTLTCVDCALHTNVSLGLHFDVSLNTNTNGTSESCLVNSNQSCFSLNKAEMNLTVHEMNLTAAVEVGVGKEVEVGANYTILRVPIAPELSVPGLISLSPAIGLGIEFDLDVATGISFTYGASGYVSRGAFASVSLIDPAGKFNPTVKADGWDGSGVDQIPFRVNDGQFAVTAGMALAPFAEIPFTILETGATLRLTENLPQLTASASLHTSVTRTCASIGPNDFEYFTTAFLVGAGMEVSTVAELILDKGVFGIEQGIPDEWEVKMFVWDVPLKPTLGVNTSTCFVLSDDGAVHPNTTVNTTSGLDAALKLKLEKLLDGSTPSSSLSGLPAPTGTMYPAAQAIPTWNMTGIESYYSVHGTLPTGVDYGQMVVATSVPSGISKAVQSVVAKESGAVGGVGVAMWVVVGMSVAVGLVLV